MSSSRSSASKSVRSAASLAASSSSSLPSGFRYPSISSCSLFLCLLQSDSCFCLLPLFLLNGFLCGWSTDESVTFPHNGINGYTGIALLTPASAPRIRDNPIFGAIRLPPAEHSYCLHHDVAVTSILGSGIPCWSVDTTFVDQEVVMDINRRNHRASIKDPM